MPAARIAVQRADSLRSERSDNNKRVSFNRDVDVKHIGKGLAPPPPPQQQQPIGHDASVLPAAPFYNVYKEPTLLSEAELAQEAERIIQQVDQISCTVSPNPLQSNYETRSLERRAAAKRNNQQHPDGPINWSRTLPTTKNQLLDKASTKKTKNVEKNNILHQQQTATNGSNPQRRATMTIEAATTPPKYDSGIEMEAATSRPNVNLIVQQLTEEARQRELLRRQYQDEMGKEDPLAPRLPALNLIEPDPQFGLTHNKNLPFSYTGGASPTRISPLRSPPPKTADVVYAQVNVARESPERNVFRSTADKVPARGKFNFQQQQEVIRQHLRYEEPEEPVDDDDDEDLDAIKAKARFLFGDDGGGIQSDVRNNNRNNNNNNNNNVPGLSFKYSTLLKDRPQPQQQQQQQQPQPDRNYTTKILIGSEQNRKRQDRHVFQYSDEDDVTGNRTRVYQDRSVSPEARIQPLTSRIRSLQMHSSPERYRPKEPETNRTLPLVKTQNHQMASTRLIQEAQRGRAVVRSRPSAAAEFTSSRLVQQHANRYADQVDGGPPKPPLRIKKLSRERMEASPAGGKVAFNTTTVPWMEPGSESSPERTYPLPRPSTNKKMPPSPYRYQPPLQRSPTGERRSRWAAETGGTESDATSRKEPEQKEEKIRRQRSKFLSVFLGSKSNKSKVVAAAAPAAPVVQPVKTTQVRVQPVAKWSAEDEAELVRQSRSLLVKGENHQSMTARVVQPANNINNNNNNRRKTSPPAVDPRYRVVTSKDVRRRSSTDRTDTSESDEVNQQRFKILRQKSQSFNNLNYRPDPVVVLSEEQHQHQPPPPPPSTQRVLRSSRRYVEPVEDARPYASTNVIHQLENERPAEEQRRQMRYFGDTDLESQPSRGGGYSSRYQPKAKVLRSASTAAGMGAVRRGVMQHRGQKQAVSSVNSSESDGSAMQSAASAESQRSVYLHATTVADIPTAAPVTNSSRAAQLQAARRKTQSREDMSALSGATGSTLRRTRHISRSYSVLAPWKPRHYRDKFEITYSNQQQPAATGDAGKPPRAPVRQAPAVIFESEDSADVYRPAVAQRPTPSSSKSGASVSRSSTMPKNTKLMAGWFRKKKQR